MAGSAAARRSRHGDLAAGGAHAVYDINEQQLTGHWRGDTLLRMTTARAAQIALYWRPLEIPPAPPRGAAGHVKVIDSI